MIRRVLRYFSAVVAMVIVGGLAQSAWAVLPTPNQPILVVQNSSSTDRYQNFVTELLRTEGLNGFQTAQLTELTSSFLNNYDVVILPRLTLTSGQATLFQNYVNNGGTLIGFRPDTRLTNVFGVSSLGSTLSEAWLKIDSATPYTSALESPVMRYHGIADLYSLNGAAALATLYNNSTSPTVSPAASINSFGNGKAILFAFDLTQSIVLMRQGNPAWAGYPNNHDGFNTLRPSQMFMDQGTGQYWNDLGDGALNDIPQADIQLRLFSNLLMLTNTAKRPLPRFWYYPTQSRAMILMTGDHHGDSVVNSINETNAIAAAGGKFTNFLWYPFTSVTNTQVNTWLTAGHSIQIHFNDTAEVDASGVGGSAVTWNGMQSVINAAMAAFTLAYPSAPTPTTTRNHFLIWVSRNASGTADQTAQAKLFQNAGIEFDTTYSAFPKRWGYMTGSGLPMKFLDTVAGTVVPVYEQATQFEDDVQLSNVNYALNWNLSTAKFRYEKALSDSLTKYNTVITLLFHPDHWFEYQGHAQTVLQYAQANSIPMYADTAWVQFWKARAATTVTKPTFSSNTLTFTATDAPDGLTLQVPHASGNNKVVSTFVVDSVAQSFSVAAYQGVMYASVNLTAGTHTVVVTYTTAGRILGQVSPSAAAPVTTIRIQGATISQNVPVAANGTYTAGPFPAGSYTVTPSSTSYAFTPASAPVTLGTADVTNVNFAATATPSGETLYTTQVPTLTNVSDGFNEALGTAFTSLEAGHITAIRFWKGPSETSNHVGRIWSGAGQLLASVSFTNETASGWQVQALSTPLLISANTQYTVSVDTSNNYFVMTPGGLAAQIGTGNLRSVVGGNGVFGTVGQFPTSSYQNGSYFRDVVFVADAVSLASVSLNPPGVTGGSSSTGTVTLSSTAPVGGAVVSLSSNNGAATVPATVNVPAGSATATFQVSTSAVASSTSVIITGNYNGPRTGMLTVDPPALSSVSLDPDTVLGGQSSTGTVTLNAPAPAGGALVTLVSGDATATIPANVTVSAGATTATFPVTTVPVASSTVVSILGSFNGLQTANLTINPPVLSSVSLNPTAVLGGQSSTGTVTLNGPAPTGGSVVALTSGNAAANVPANVTVPAGATAANFPVTTIPVVSTTAALIGGSYGGAQSATLTINPPALASVSLNPATVVGNQPSTGTVTLTGAAPAGGVLVTLSSDNAAATVPANVTVPAGESTANFPVATISVGTATAVLISATSGGTQSATLTVNPPALAAVFLNPGTVIGGSFSTGTVTLTNPAPVGGAVVMLSSDNPAAVIDESVTVAAGAMTADFTVATQPVGALTSVGISGVYLGARTATLTIKPPAPSSVSLDPSSVTGGASVIGTVRLSNLAPVGGTVVALFSDNAAATVPANVTVLAGNNVAEFAVGTTAVGSATSAVIAAVAYNEMQSATLTINPPALSSLLLNPGNVVGGHSATATVILNGPAASGGVVVTLASDDATASVPTSVTVAPGATTATFSVSTTAVVAPTGVNISASYLETAAAPLTVTPAGLAAVSLNPASVAGGSASVGTVTLTGPAPVGGATVMLITDDAIVPAIEGVYSSSGLPSAGSIDWASLGPDYSFLSSGTAVPVGGLPGVSATLSTANGQSMMTLTNCSTGGSCGWYGNFTSGVKLLWTSGIYNGATGWWGANGPLTVQFNTPQRGIGFQIMADELGPFTATLCAYDSTNTLLGCVPFDGNGNGNANGSAVFVGLYDDAQEISKVTVDAGGLLYPHDFAISHMFVTGTRRSLVPVSVTVPAGAISADFPVNTSAVASTASVTVTGAYLAAQQIANLSIHPATLASVSLTPGAVSGGTALTGTVTLNGAAPAGGSVVMLSANNPVSSGVQSVNTTSALPKDGSVSWNTLGSVFTSVPSGAVVPVSGMPGLTVTVSTATQNSGMVLANCPVPTGFCAFWGNFAPNEPLLWVNGVYDGQTGSWTGNGPLTLTLNTPQRGLAFRIMADEGGPFSATVCAYNSADVLLGCKPYNGTGAPIAGGSNGIAAVVGIYRDSADIAKVTIDGGGALYPHDFAIGTVSVATSRRMVPSSVKVQPGATSATFTVNTDSVDAATDITVTGDFGASHDAVLTVNPSGE